MRGSRLTYRVRRLDRSCSLIVLFALLIGFVPPAASPWAAAAPAVAVGLPLPTLAEPVGMRVRSTPPPGISDLRIFSRGNTGTLVTWMTDHAYEFVLEYGPTQALGQRLVALPVHSQGLSSGAFVHRVNLPLDVDGHFFRIAALQPGTQHIVAYSDIIAAGAGLGRVEGADPTSKPGASHTASPSPGSTATDTAQHEHHAHQAIDAVTPTVASTPPAMDTNTAYCDLGGDGSGPLADGPPPNCGGPSVADPVMLGDGSWFLSVPCLSVGGAGLPINVGLRYSTHMWLDNMGMSSIGKGWTVGYSRRLIWDNPGGRVVLSLESGYRWPFDRDGTGQFVSGDGNYTRMSYNATAGEYTLTYRNGVRDVFDNNGLLKRVEDRFNNQTLISFSVVGTIGTQTIRNARTNQAILLEHEDYNGVWRLVRIKDAATNGGTQRQITLSYGTTGADADRLTKVTDAAGRVYTFGYEVYGRITTYYDPNNNPEVVTTAKPTINVYSGGQDVTQQTLPNGTTINFSRTYRVGGDMTITYNAGQPDQRIERYRLNGTSNGGLSGRIERAYVPNSDSAYTKMDYDPHGNVEWTTDPLGRRMQYLYNSSGNLIEARTYKNYTAYDSTVMEYNAFGQLTKLIEPAGDVTEWSYNVTTGAIETITRRATINGVALAQTTTVETNPVTINGAAVRTGLITGIKLPDGTWNTQSYDSRGYPAVTTYDANYGTNTGRLALTESTAYDWRGYLVGETNQQGIATTYEYATTPGHYGIIGWPSAVTFDSATGGRAVRAEYTYDRVGNLLKVIEDVGTGRVNATWQYQYVMADPEGNYAVSQITDPLSQITRYTYTIFGDLKKLIEVNPKPGQTERATSFDYTSEGWLKQVTLHDGRAAERYEHNVLGETTAMTDAVGVVTGYGYDPKGRLSFTTNTNMGLQNLANGKVPAQSSTYGSGYEASKAVDGNPTTFAWTNYEAQAWWQVDLGASYDLSSIQVFDDGPYTADFYVFVSNTPFTSTDPNITKTQAGVSSYYTSGVAGSPTAISLAHPGRYIRVQLANAGTLGLYEVKVLGSTAIAATAPVTRYTYDANDRVTRVTEKVNATTTRTTVERAFDGFSRLAWEKDGLGNQTSYGYDNTRNWLTLATVGSNVASEQLQTQYGYDKLGRLAQQVVDPGTGRKNLTTNYFYTATGSTDRWHLQRVQEPRGAVTTYAYNSLGQLARTVDAQGAVGTWTYGYNNLGTLTTITPPSGAVTSYEIDPLQRTKKLTRNGQSEAWTYNPDDTLATYQDFAAQTTAYSYDLTGRLTLVDRPGTTADASLTYFANDLLKTATSKPDGVTDETTTYSYDARNRLASRTRDSRAVSYGYNLDDTLQKLTYWNRGDVTYGYNNAAQLTTINPWAGGTSTYTYRATDLLKDITRPASNGIKTTLSYDTASRVTGVQHVKGTTNINTIQYVPDNNGNVTQMTDLQGTTNYQYDVLNRLVQAQYPAIPSGPPAQTASYAYDRVGNRTLNTATEPRVTTVAGQSGLGSANGSGSAARFFLPSGVTLSADGSFALVADSRNHTIRKITLATNTVTTIAGSVGAVGSADGTGTAARFHVPADIALSPDNTFALISDLGNHTIRKLVLSTGVVTTVAGSATIAGSADGTGTAARFRFPSALEISSDGSFALIVDRHNHTIRKLVLSTGAVTTVAGSATIAGSADGTGSAATFNYPNGITISADRSFALVSDTNNHTIRKLVLSTGAVSTIVGAAGSPGATDGVGTAARLYNPNGIRLSQDGTVAVIANWSHHTIRKLVLSTGAVSTIGGTVASPGGADGTGTAARFFYPAHVALSADGSVALITDFYNHTVRKIALSTNAVTTVAGQSGWGSTDGTGSAARFGLYGSVSISPDRSFALITDQQNNLIRKLVFSTGAVTTLAGSAGQYGTADGTGTAARFNAPMTGAISPDGSFALIADQNNHTIRKLVLSTGAVTTIAGTVGAVGSTDGIGTAARFNYPAGITLSGDGSVALIADRNNHTVRKLVLSTGAVTTVAGGVGTVGNADGTGTAARFNYPRSVALSTDGSVALIADQSNHTIRKLVLGTGAVTTLAGSAGVIGSTDGVGTAARFSNPGSVTISSDGTFALVTDLGNHTIRRIVLSSGVVTTLAGSAGLFGNTEGLGQAARFFYPFSVAMSPNGSFALVLDSYNFTLRRLDHVASTYDASDRTTNSTFTYDLNGNLTRDADGTTYAYDTANRLTRTVKGSTTTDYFYDALGNLIRQRITNGTNVATTSFVLDEGNGLPQVIGEVRSDGTETLYAYGAEGLHARRDITSGGITSTSYPLLDGLGSVRQWTKGSDGSVQQSLSYDAWGMLRHMTGSNPAGGTGLRNGLGFTGEQQRDDGTVHLRARAYQPHLGRFLQRDSFAGFTSRPQSLNRYAYTEGNPVNSTDPSGHFVETALDVASVGLSAHDLWKSVESGCDIWQNAALLGLDILGAGLPFIPALGMVRRANNANKAFHKRNPAEYAKQLRRRGNSLKNLKISRVEEVEDGISMPLPRTAEKLPRGGKRFSLPTTTPGGKSAYIRTNRHVLRSRTPIKGGHKSSKLEFSGYYDRPDLSQQRSLLPMNFRRTLDPLVHTEPKVLDLARNNPNVDRSRPIEMESLVSEPPCQSCERKVRKYTQETGQEVRYKWRDEQGSHTWSSKE